MTDADLTLLTHRVLSIGFALSFLFGALCQRTHFCVMGAVADVVTMGDWRRARMWALAVAVAMVGFATLAQLGWVSADQTLYGARRLPWASHLVGGLLFGIGMVLAAGCGAKTLVRAGAGNIKSLVVMGVMGLSALMTLRGLTAVWRDATVDQWASTLPRAQDLASLLGQPWLGFVLAAVLVAWVLASPTGRQAPVLWGGIGVGFVVVGVWALTSHLALVPEHPQSLAPAYVATAFNRPEALSFVAPVAGALDWLMFFSDRSKTLNLGIVSVLGVMLGSAAVALWRHEFRWEGFRHTEDLVNHLMGAMLMGVGGITALGCTIGQGISGLSTLSLGSGLAVVGIVLGAVLALRYQTWRVGA